MSDQRHWIMNPRGHRAFANEMNPHQTGDTVDTPMGEAVFLKLPDPQGGAWYCDICSSQILTAWGDEPMPVPADGSYALCGPCRERIEQGPRFSDRTGEPIPNTQAGPWPPAGCNCPPCQNTTQAWGRQLVNAYHLTP
jgi:hypothetical protein